MTRIRGRLGREQFPAGLDGDTLTLSTHNPHGLAWRTGANRLIHDLTPELSAELDCNGNKLVELGTPTAGTDAVTKTYADALVLERSYFLAKKAVPPTTTTSLSGLTYYWTKPGGWTSLQADEWAEDGTTGNFEYSGAFPASNSRLFRVAYALNMSGYTTVTKWMFLAKITKIPSGGSVADVSGSIQAHLTFATTSFFAARLASHQLACSTLVSVASGDSISFQYGNYVDAAGTYNLQNTSYGDGIVLSITPADVAP